MKNLLTITMLCLATIATACDAPDQRDDEAEQLALEEDLEAAQDKEEITDDDKPPFDNEDNDQIQAQADEESKANVDEFDLKANAEQHGPPGKCCKALCTWYYDWQQLPWPASKADNCNYNANAFCGTNHLRDAQWRTCGPG